MKLIIFILMAASSVANAGTAKLTWRHDGRAVDGSIVPITAFSVYWGYENDVIDTPIKFNRPNPWKTENGTSTWSKTFTEDAWVPGTTICFQMTAFSYLEESDRANTICKTFSFDPSAPVIIDIDRP